MVRPQLLCWLFARCSFNRGLQSITTFLLGEATGGLTLHEIIDVKGIS
jgi:hypothetical protein